MAFAAQARVPYSGKFGRYEVLFPLAAGGMGHVYVARAHGAAAFTKLVALKTIRPELTEDRALVERFENEGRLAANISSPYVANTLDFGVATDGTLYLVMEFVLGASLRELMRDAGGVHGTPLPVLLKVLVQIAQGLHDAHQAKDAMGAPLGLVHRDLSPHNVIVGVDGRPRIVDFGVARALWGDSMTKTGEVVGKFGYFSPEQLTGDAVDQRSDIFALGVVAWELIAGERLFQADSAYEGVKKVMEAPIPDLRERREDVPDEVWNVVRRSLERSRKKRIQSAAAFSQDLQRAALATCGIAHEQEIGNWARSRGASRVDELERGLRGAKQVEEPATGSEMHLWDPAGNQAAKGENATVASGTGRARNQDQTVSTRSRGSGRTLNQGAGSHSRAQKATPMAGLRKRKSSVPGGTLPFGDGVSGDDEGSTYDLSVIIETGTHQGEELGLDELRKHVTKTKLTPGTLRTKLLHIYAKKKWLSLKLVAMVGICIAAVALVIPKEQDAGITQDPRSKPAPAAKDGESSKEKLQKLLAEVDQGKAENTDEANKALGEDGASGEEAAKATPVKSTNRAKRARSVHKSPKAVAALSSAPPVSEAPAAASKPAHETKTVTVTKEESWMRHKWLQGVKDFDAETNTP